MGFFPLIFNSNPIIIILVLPVPFTGPYCGKINYQINILINKSVEFGLEYLLSSTVARYAWKLF
jgi:hypothetical protein